MPAGSSSRLVLRIAAVIAVLFGIATVASGGSVLFGEGAEGAGNYVPFIVWFNFVAGLFYIAPLGLHISSGGPYETRTLVAMTLRLGVWLAIAALAMRFDVSQGRCRGA
jgi:hypothetical protein